MMSDSPKHEDDPQPASQVISFGHCKGCYRMARLDDDVCHLCLTSPQRGRRWAEMSHRCRTDPAFARIVYDRIGTDHGRRLFVRMYGLPIGAKPAAPMN
jgi:hypothetical protein